MFEVIGYLVENLCWFCIGLVVDVMLVFGWWCVFCFDEVVVFCRVVDLY